LSPRRILLVCAAAAMLAMAAAPANAAQVVNGTIAPSKLKGKPTAVMFLHPF
jgi:predicted nicotinamide N-methyase